MAIIWQDIWRKHSREKLTRDLRWTHNANCLRKSMKAREETNDSRRSGKRSDTTFILSEMG